MRISAIVPTWCEAPRIGGLIRTLVGEVDEIIVVDADSTDGTAGRAERGGARVVQSERGRGVQLDAGARAATGEALVFVHADTLIPRGFGRAIRGALAEAEIAGGNFRLRYVPETPTARIFTVANDLRRRFLGSYYGDSCVFVRRAVYEATGGFGGLPLFEDHVFVQRLEAAGRTRYVRSPEIATSARRFEQRPLRALAAWGALQLAFSLGVPPTILARYYADHR